MKTVYKFQAMPYQTVLMVPYGEVLTTGLQNGLFTAWVLVETNPHAAASSAVAKPLNNKTMIVEFAGTGHPLPAHLTKEHYVNTFFEGEFVFHAFAWEG